MKKYVITFHWASNYGAVLQAYALQRYLQQNGDEVAIIDYTPSNLKKTFLRCFLAKPNKYPRNFAEFKKEKKIAKFRKKYFTLTKLYKNNSKLHNEQWDKATFICGSDQIWNPFFTMKGEGGITLSYFLDFVPATSEKVAYAGSFGVTQLSEEMQKIVSAQLKTFKKVSVREQSAVSMLQEIDVQAELVCDPVFLPKAETWLSLRAQKSYEKKRVFTYILHENQTEAKKISDYVQKVFDADGVGNKPVEVERWLGDISVSEFVVTNSFHATAFSVIFRRPFVAVLLKQSGMNDRLITLLKALGLEDRIVYKFDSLEIDEKINAPIDWDSVSERLEALRKTSISFLES